MRPQHHGFSLIELLVALAVALVLSMMMFQLFQQNERVMRDQTLIMEVQQTARVVASQIADEIRTAGQGVPLYASGFDHTASEPVAVILPTSTSSRIDFRSGLSNVETTPSAAGPLDLTLGVSRTLTVAAGSGSGFSTGKFVYVTGPGTNMNWSWIRAELAAAGSSSMTLIPRNSADSAATIRFTAPPGIALEEAVSFSLNNGAVRRAAASNTSNPSNPTWGAANEIGRNFTALQFTYYDLNNAPVQPTTLANRNAIVRVDIQLSVQTAARLSNGSRPTYSMSLRTGLRNARLRAGPM
jgi:prepilin-type N-terminal cleavage/methylation domain-containing protein